MSLPRVTNTLGTVSQLDDRPNDTGGLTAAELKAKFDKDSGTLKTFLNDTLLPYLESSSAAAQLGIQTIPGFSAADIQTALEQIVKAMQDVTQGSVADGSITLAKLAADVTAAALGGAAASHTHGAADVSSGVLDVERIPALTGDKLPDGIVTEGKLGAAAVTSEKLAALSVLATHIAQKAVTGQKIADKTITAANMADDARYNQSVGIVADMALALGHGNTVIHAYSPTTTITLTKEVADVLPNGWRCFIAAHTPITFSWGEITRMVDMSGHILTNGSGSIAIPQWGFIWLRKHSATEYEVFGSYTADQFRHTYTGTTTPSANLGANGDIYIKYNA